MESVIQEVILCEWDMFDAVKGSAGRASCQDDYETFYIMRKSQLEAWNGEMRESYLSDLKTAQNKGHNLLSEKYAYMMEFTVPEEFEALRENLPVISDQKKKMVRRIVDIQLAWQEEAAEEYPALAGAGRSVYSSEDTLYETSFETYLRGELCTYSMNTLELYEKYILELLEQNRNLNLEILSNMSREYGYASLDQAEQRMRGQEM